MKLKIATATADYAQNWQGYISRILYTGGTYSIASRAAQTSVAANNQNVLYNYSGNVDVGTATTPAVAAFTANQQYTDVLRITKSGAAALTIVSTSVVGGVFVSHGPPILQIGETKTARFVRRRSAAADHLSYVPEFSADLVAWESNTATMVIIAEDTDYQYVELPVPASLAVSSRIFFRVRVTLTP